jgi:hypothetical protein
MFIFFTNASEQHKGKSVAINSDAILSVTESEFGGSWLFAGNDISWHVEEDYLETVSALNSAK